MTLCLTFVHELSYIMYCHPQTTFHTTNTNCKHQMKNIPTSQHFSIHSNAITVYTAVTVQLFEYYEGWNFNSGNYLFTTDTK